MAMAENSELLISWEALYQKWKSRLADYSVSLESLFSEIRIIEKPEYCGREDVFSWWNVREIDELQTTLQKFIAKNPGLYGPVHPQRDCAARGLCETANYLWRIQDDPESVCALLISASLFSRIHSSRRDYPRGYWPPMRYLLEIDNLAKEVLSFRFGGRFPGWHHSCTNVLPVRVDDFKYRIDTSLGIVRYLAEEHASALCSYRPVIISFDSE